MAITKINTPELLDINTTGAKQLPSGPTTGTGGRPTTGLTAGDFRYNTTDNRVEYYDGAAWFQIDTEAIPSLVPVGSENFNTNTYFGTGATQAIDAKFNEAAAFSGQDNGSFINLGSSNIFSPVTQGAITFSCWIKTSNGNSGYIASKVNDKSGGAYEWAIEQLSNGTLTLIAYNNSVPALAVTSSINNTATIDDGNWHNVVAVIVNNTASINGSTTLYIDGVSATSTNWTGTAAESSTAVVFLGAVGRDNVNPPVQPLAAQHYGGLMDQVRFYNSALDQADVTALQLETTTTASSLSFPSGKTAIATYQLDGNSNDITGNNNGSTPTNTDPIGYTGLKFEPDFTWIKAREASSSHVLFDSIRGVSNVLSTESISDQSSLAPYGLTAFNNDGFTVKDIASGGNGVNGSAGGTYSGTKASYVAWNWYAPTSQTNNSGTNGASVTSTIKKNVDAGFSIVKWTATNNTNTIAHGIDTPQLIIIKAIDVTSNWQVYAEPAGNNKKLILDDSLAAANTTIFDSTSPTPSVFTFNDAGITGDIIAYCFQSISGYQKIGTYEGTGNLGISVYTTDDGTSTGTNGFKPSFLLLKAIDDVGAWFLFDNKRNPTNPVNKILEAQYNGPEITTGTIEIDFETNGFTVNSSNSQLNIAGDFYIFLAIA